MKRPEDLFAVADTEVYSNERSYSLLLLFYVTTLAAVLFAACREAAIGSNWSTTTFFTGWGGFGFAGMVLGTCVAWYAARTPLGLMLGLGIGIAVALIATFLVFITSKNFLQICMVSCAGCWLIAMVAITVQRIQSASR